MCNWIKASTLLHTNDPPTPRRPPLPHDLAGCGQDDDKINPWETTVAMTRRPVPLRGGGTDHGVISGLVGFVNMSNRSTPPDLSAVKCCRVRSRYHGRILEPGFSEPAVASDSQAKAYRAVSCWWDKVGEQSHDSTLGLNSIHLATATAAQNTTPIPLRSHTCQSHRPSELLCVKRLEDRLDR